MVEFFYLDFSWVFTSFLRCFIYLRGLFVRSGIWRAQPKPQISVTWKKDIYWLLQTNSVPTLSESFFIGRMMEKKTWSEINHKIKKQNWVFGTKSNPKQVYVKIEYSERKPLELKGVQTYLTIHKNKASLFSFLIVKRNIEISFLGQNRHNWVVLGEHLMIYD